MKNIKNLILIILIIVYEEILFSMLAFNSVEGIWYKLLFSISIGLIINAIASLRNEKFNKIIFFILISLICMIFVSQYVNYKFYEGIISIYSILNGGQVFEFWNTILSVIMSNWKEIILLLFPIIYISALNWTKKIEFEIIKIDTVLRYLKIFLSVFVIIFVIIAFSNKNDIYSAKNLYCNTHIPTLTAKKFGILTTMRLDLQRTLFGFKEKNISYVNNPNIVPITEEQAKEYNITQIDWEAVSVKTSNENIKLIDEYISKQEPTAKNEYTGMFEGKNLIVIVAEAFCDIAIDEELTPTLYKLYNQGFQFDNFYTPLFPVSTADGEYTTDNSLIPKEGVWSISKVNGNFMPYSYANVFEGLGYKSQAYHNHYATYYNRTEYMQTMGYDSFIANGTGLETRMDCNNWPNSDLEMINTTVNDYINEEKFIAYYMTVSGHLEYNQSGNYIVRKNWDLVKDLPYSDKAKSYMATQIELDKAVESLINSLEAADKLDDTVIVISGDHYPYGLKLNEMNELSEYKKDDTFEKHHMPFLIWNSKMEQPIKVQKYGCSLDVLPTVYNLFGVEYDSRLLMGSDLLSDSDSLVIFSNRSFITEKGKYNAITKNFIAFDSLENITEEYINEISSIIYNKYQISRLILEEDYYRSLWDRINSN